ncbi:MAG TPA: hypothetical protein DHV36_10800 [Desulfobacteraceae bacterium]|nr:hypothetical protein [Desulfobacteraceae bacterium]
MPRIVTVNDQMQQGYTYECTAPVGKEFHPEFQPALTPKELLALGIFGGCYMNDCREEFPEDWFENARLSPGKRDPSLNYYKVEASQSLAMWEDMGWIHPDDPRGWFQWYCRYFMGRRVPEEDLRQIRRWKGISRHVGAIKKNCTPGDESCRPKQRQALLHWAYDPRIL